MPYMRSTDLSADCTACRGLCCIALPFFAEQGFGFDKPAATRCIHLGRDAHCRIHEQLAERGFTGCVAFDCHGAGQRVCRAVPPSEEARGFAAFEVLRPLQALMALLHTAQRHADDPRLRAQLAYIDALCESALATPWPCDIDVATVQQQTMRLLTELKVLPGVIALRAVQPGPLRPPK